MNSEQILAMLKFTPKRYLPMITQGEIAECGLACLAMVASYWGYETNLPALRQRFVISSRGMNLEQVAQLATEMKLSCQGFELELEELGELKTPCILHWDLNHFVVLKKVTSTTITIHDPAIGVREIGFKETSKHFTGVALQLSPEVDFVAKKDIKTISIKEFWGSLKGIESTLLMLFCISLIVQFWGMLNPMLTRIIVDEVIVYKDTSLLISVVIGFGLVTLFSVASQVIRSMYLMYMSKTISIQVYNTLFGKLIRLPLSFFIKRQTGDILSRFGSVQAIQGLVTTTFIESLLDGIMVIFTFSMMLMYSGFLTMITISTLSIYVAMRAATVTKFRELNEEMIIADGRERTSFVETLRSIQPIKLFGKEQYRQNTWLATLAKSFNTHIRTEQISTIYGVINKLLFSIENIIVLYGCATLIIQPESQFTLGMMYAFLQYKGQFTGSITSLIDNFFQIKMINLHLERLSDIALHENDHCFQESEKSKASLEVTGALEVKNLSFKYDKHDPLLFEDISFSINQGESIAIVGPSGCGKSSLMKILVGLIPQDSGSIFIDGININERKLSTYREQIATVMQNDTLLSGSIKENITFFDDNIDEKYLIECAKIACIHQDIENMTMGYSTLVGELGSHLSGGQQQRILLARALYKKPKILFMDEATSHLDIATEFFVNQAIANLKITRIMIAHRPETIKSANRVLVLNNKKIIEQTELESYAK